MSMMSGGSPKSPEEAEKIKEKHIEIDGNEVLRSLEISAKSIVATMTMLRMNG